jgi:hypothetical protein
MLPHGFISSISAEGHCRQASTTGCCLPASLPKSTAGGTAGSLRALTLFGAIIYATSRRTLDPGSTLSAIACKVESLRSRSRSRMTKGCTRCTTARRAASSRRARLGVQGISGFLCRSSTNTIVTSFPLPKERPLTGLFDAPRTGLSGRLFSPRLDRLVGSRAPTRPLRVF